MILISVFRRTLEIGLLKALGTPQKQILRLFLVEASILALSGAVDGIVIAFSPVWLVPWIPADNSALVIGGSGPGIPAHRDDFWGAACQAGFPA